jgi:hypothetical protein
MVCTGDYVATNTRKQKRSRQCALSPRLWWYYVLLRSGKVRSMQLLMRQGRGYWIGSCCSPPAD